MHYAPIQDPKLALTWILQRLSGQLQARLDTDHGAG
jgi:hypothetical protein